MNCINKARVFVSIQQNYKKYKKSLPGLRKWYRSLKPEFLRWHSTYNLICYSIKRRLYDHMFRWTHLRFLRFDEPAVTGDKFYSILRASDTFVIFFKYCFISLLRSSDNRLHSFMKKYKLNDHRECLRLLITSLNVLPISSSPSFGIVIN